MDSPIPLTKSSRLGTVSLTLILTVPTGSSPMTMPNSIFSGALMVRLPMAERVVLVDPSARVLVITQK